MKLNTKECYKDWKAPAFRILVKIKKLEEASEGGIILTSSYRDQVEYSSGEGIVVDMGPTAFDAFEGDKWCKVGDEVKFKSYAGCQFTFLDEDGEEALYRFINDDDIVGVKETNNG